MISRLSFRYFESLNSKKSVKIIILLATGLIASLLIFLPISLRQVNLEIKPGEVSPQDITAPKSITYTSDVITKEKRDQAEKQTQPVYMPADLNITRQQLAKLQTTLSYIETIISDEYSTKEEKLNDIAALSNTPISNDISEDILALDISKWKTLRIETMRVFEQIMRNPIRDYQVENTKQGVQSLVSFSFPEDQITIINTLIAPNIVANSMYSEEATINARLNAKKAIAPITRTFLEGEKVVDKGHIITEADIEALEQLGLKRPQTRVEDIISIFSIVSICTAFVGLFFSRRKFSLVMDARSVLAISVIFLLFLIGARLSIPARVVIPYLYPLAAFGLTLACLFNVEIGLIFSLIISILATYNSDSSADLMVYYSLSSLCGVLILGRGYRIANFLLSGIMIGVSGSAVILAFRLTETSIDFIGLATLIGASFLNGLASASIALVLQFLFSQLLGLTTALRLLDLSRPDHPLLQSILFKAPGTYQHSLQVANLAERAAEAIGADALLVRVGALYHDAGKAANPLFFIENQIPGTINPHLEMDPTESASIIIQHVSDGMALANQHRLSSRVKDFIVEHHGTMITRYQYAKAIEKHGDDNVDKTLFRYPGPKPSSKETAILMLADGCEAKARAELPKDEDELRLLVKKVFEYIQKDGQLDNTNLTLRDLHVISENFITTLKNTHHPRILYPEPPEKKSSITISDTSNLGN